MAPKSQSKDQDRSHLFRIIQALEKSSTVSYVLDSQCVFLYCNPAWDRFAKSNEAPGLRGEVVIGSDLFDVIPTALSKFYAETFQKVRTRQQVWEHSYECSSPDLFRKYRMRIHFLTRRNWFLVTNPLIFQRKHRNPARPDPKKYVSSTGLITMCAHCRCANRVDNPDQWDFVPEYLQFKGQDSLQLSHGFCPTCYAYFNAA